MELQILVVELAAQVAEFMVLQQVELVVQAALAS
jgi:hypothetical protein